MKYRLLKKEAIGNVIETASMIFDKLLPTYRVLSLEIRSTSLFFCKQEELELVRHSLELMGPLKNFHLWNNVLRRECKKLQQSQPGQNLFGLSKL